MQLINHDAMAQAFPDGLLVLPEHLAALITHAPTRAFLRDVGLPDRERWFESSQELVDGRVRIGGEAWQRVAEQHPGCPFDMGGRPADHYREHHTEHPARSMPDRPGDEADRPPRAHPRNRRGFSTVCGSWRGGRAAAGPAGAAVVAAPELRPAAAGGDLG